MKNRLAARVSGPQRTALRSRSKAADIPRGAEVDADCRRVVSRGWHGDRPATLDQARAELGQILEYPAPTELKEYAIMVPPLRAYLPVHIEACIPLMVVERHNATAEDISELTQPRTQWIGLRPRQRKIRLMLHAIV